MIGWAEARVKIARVTLTIKLDGNWSSFQLANSAPPLSVTDSAIAPSARIPPNRRGRKVRSTSANDAPFRKNTLRRADQFGSHRPATRNAWWPRLLPTTGLVHVGTRRSLKNCISHIDASHSRQPLVKGERLVRYEVNTVIHALGPPGRAGHLQGAVVCESSLG